MVDYGVKDLPMLERVGHVRENILTEEQAKKLGFSTNNKHYHGLGVKTYLEIIDSMDNSIGVYQYIDDPNNFIVLTPVKFNGYSTIVPIEINNKGQYNQVEINFNRLKSVYAKLGNNDYIKQMLEKGKIKEIFTQFNSEQTSLDTSILSKNEKYVNNDIAPVKSSNTTTQQNKTNLLVDASSNILDNGNKYSLSAKSQRAIDE